MWPFVVPHTTLSVTSERRPDSGSGEQLDIDGVAGGREKKGEEVVVEVGEGRKEVEQVGEGLKEVAAALVVLGERRESMNKRMGGHGQSWPIL